MNNEQNAQIVTSIAYPNYSGVLYNRSDVATPFLNMIAGKTAYTNSVEFVIGQKYNSEEGEIPNISENDSLVAPKETAVTRSGQMTNVTQIFHETFGVSDAKKSNMGTLSGINIEGQVANPQSEEDFQAANKMIKIKRSIEKTFILGQYNKAANDSQVNKTRGMIQAITSNTIDAEGAALDLWLLNDIVTKIKNNHGDISNLYVWLNTENLMQITGNAIEMGLPVGTAYMSAFGVQVRDVILPIGATVKLALGEYVPHGTALVINFDPVRPVEQPVPGKGNFYREQLARVGAGDRYQIFGQIGLDHGPEWFHGKITGLSTEFVKPQGQKIVTVTETASNNEEISG